VKLFLTVWLSIKVLGTFSEDFDMNSENVEAAPSQCMLAKRKRRASASENSEETLGYNYKPRMAGHAMSYFKEWNNIGIEKTTDKQRRISGQSLLETEKMMDVLVSALVKQHSCSAHLFKSQNWRLMEHEMSHPFSHILLKSSGGAGKMQFISMMKNHIVKADPPINCAAELQLNAPAVEKEAGGLTTLLHPERDSMVNDCKKLFERTAEDHCKKKIKISRVLRAARLVIDGVEVEMDVEIEGSDGKTTHHAPVCVFELEAGSKDASLLELNADPAETDPIEEEKMGMTATLKTVSDLCRADEQDGENVLTELPPMGLLSLYKGYEHSEALPRAIFAEKENVPTDFNMQTKYPKCFLEGGKEVARYQGSCGSCWAFAGASAIMNTLCASKESDPSLFASPTDRYEVSVQQIMSCNSGEAGCKGGVNVNVHDAVKQQGLSREREHPYRCGAGDAKDHWKQDKKGECGQPPWGAQCQQDKVPEWNYGGAFHLSGESQQMSMLSQGYSLTVGMKVYASFEEHGGPRKSMEERKKVWTGPADKVLGGHAMAAIGYGVQDGTKYWLIQNSWSVNWGVAGTVKIIRGINIGGIEEGMFLFRTWVTGAAEPVQPECRDADHVDGLRKPWGDSCTKAVNDVGCHMPRVSLSCPVSCNSCPPRSVPGPSPEPPAPRPEPPAPVPEPPVTEAPEPEPEPAPVPPPPPAPSGGKEIILGSSTDAEKCVTLDLTMDCEMTVAPSGSYSQNQYNDLVCVYKEGGWTEEVAFTCKPFDFEW